MASLRLLAPATLSHPPSDDQLTRATLVIYLRAAQAYMLISMPTGTSTIFGAFQAIVLSSCHGTFLSSGLNYRAKKSSPTEYFCFERSGSIFAGAKSGRVRVAAVKSTNS
jgi:hypothetical protein